MILLKSIFVLNLVCHVCSQKYIFGSKCPTYFQHGPSIISSMQGRWYVHLSTYTAEHCVEYTYSRKSPDYFLEIKSQHTYFGLERFRHNYVITKHRGRFENGNKEVDFPLSMYGPAKHCVISTDRSSYAVVMLCNEMAFAHRVTIAVLAKNKKNMVYHNNKTHITVSKILADNGIAESEMAIISHEDCGADGKRGTKTYAYKEDEFCFHSLGSALKATGDLLARSIYFLVNYGKSVVTGTQKLIT